MADAGCSPDDEVKAAAIDYYEKAVAERRASGEEFCRVCGAAGWLLMERATYTAMLDSIAEDDPDREEVVESLAILRAKKLPVHPAAANSEE